VKSVLKAPALRVARDGYRRNPFARRERWLFEPSVIAVDHRSTADSHFASTVALD
jgi:hypothetical protein